MSKAWTRQCAPGLLLAVIALSAMSCKGEKAASSPATQKYAESPQLALDGAQSQILMLDVAQLRRLPLYGSLKKELLKQDDEHQWNDLKAALGGEPLDLFERLLICAYDFVPGKPSPILVIGVGAFEKPADMVAGYVGFMGKHYADNVGPVIPDDRNGVPMFQSSGGKMRGSGEAAGFYFAFPGPNIMIFSTELKYVLQTLDVMSGAKPDLTSQPHWKTRLNTPNLLGSMIWAAGDFPAEYNKRINAEMNSAVELKGMHHLDNASAFAAKLRFSGREYLLESDFLCEQVRQTQAMRDELESARSKGKLAEAATRVFGLNPARTPTLDKMLKGAVFTALDSVVRATLRKDTTEGEAMIRDWLNPPAAAPAAEAAKPGPAGEGAPDPGGDPFKDGS